MLRAEGRRERGCGQREGGKEGACCGQRDGGRVLRTEGQGKRAADRLEGPSGVLTPARFPARRRRRRPEQLRWA